MVSRDKVKPLPVEEGQFVRVAAEAYASEKTGKAPPEKRSLA